MELSFDAAISSLRAKAAEFTRLYNEFVNAGSIARQSPELWEEWKAAKFRADAVRDTIMWINTQVDAAANWLASTFGLNGLNAVGVIPLLPVAYVTGAIAALVAAMSAMSYSLGHIYEFKRRADIAERTGDVSVLETPTLAGGVSDVLKWAIVGGALYFIVPKLLDRRGK